MNIWCDVCSKKKASVFCSADEAALCDDCDSRVHQANKLASKHQRFSLLQSSSSQSPICDICQEKKALLFCQQDRAILCRDCDVSIHTANELTKNHNRFLLTGVKLTTAKPSIVTKSHVKSDDSVPDFRPQNLTNKISVLNFKAQPTTANTDVNSQLISNGGSTSSTISEYLIDILPGWQVEDLLDSSSSDPVGFFKDNEKDMLFLDSDLESGNCSYENMGLWVPQTPAVSQQQQPSPFNLGIYGVNGLEMGKGGMGKKVSRKRIDDGFTVPEISQQFLGSKRFRSFY
ncbi:hypothetical protein V2J09_023826 [Rumex salicifolius]